MVAVMFLYQITVVLQQNTTASLLELYFNDSMQTVYARGGGGGSRQREVADGADVVFTDTGIGTRGLEFRCGTGRKRIKPNTIGGIQIYML